MDGMIQFYIETTNITKDQYNESKGRTFINNLCIASRREPDARGNTLSVFIYDAANGKKTYVGSGKLRELNADGKVADQGDGDLEGKSYSADELYGIQDAIIVNPKNQK